MIVDEATDEKVRLRDPYHGWEITVSKKSFTSVWEGSRIGDTIIQVG